MQNIITRAKCVYAVVQIHPTAARSLATTQLRSKDPSDPVQKLFVDKIREYKSKSKGGQLVDPSPEITKELKTEMEKLERQFSDGTGQNMNEFPTFQFGDPKLDPIDEPEAKADAKKK